MTITAGRDEHLHRQRLGLAACSTAISTPGSESAELHVIVAMGDAPQLRQAVGAPPVLTRHVPVESAGLPLAAARNRGARAAIEAGIDLIVFLDVDCIPGERLIGRYSQAAARCVSSPTLLCGPVSYLPPPPPDGYPTTDLRNLAGPHPARPAPPDGHLLDDHRFELFWSLSFAVSAATWTALGGFDEAFVGYGAEDTDFAFRAKSAGARLSWVGGAEAYHQHHEQTWNDPLRVGEMSRNAKLFYARHGTWPMRAWLDDLAARNLIIFDPGEGRLETLAGP